MQKRFSELNIGDYSRDMRIKPSAHVRKANACMKCCVQKKDESQFNADDVKAVINLS